MDKWTHMISLLSRGRGSCLRLRNIILFSLVIQFRAFSDQIKLTITAESCGIWFFESHADTDVRSMSMTCPVHVCRFWEKMVVLAFFLYNYLCYQFILTILLLLIICRVASRYVSVVIHV